MEDGVGTLTHREFSAMCELVVHLSIYELLDHMCVNLLAMNTQSQNTQAVLVVIGDGVTFLFWTWKQEIRIRIKKQYTFPAASHRISH